MSQADTTVPAGEASALGKFGWAMFDWANQPFFTVVVTFIFAPYFATVVVGDPVGFTNTEPLSTRSEMK